MSMPCARIIIRESPRARSLWVLAVVCVEEMIEDKVLTHTRARSPARDGRGRRVRPRPTLCLDLGIPTPQGGCAPSVVSRDRYIGIARKSKSNKRSSSDASYRLHGLLRGAHALGRAAAIVRSFVLCPMHCIVACSCGPVALSTLPCPIHAGVRCSQLESARGRRAATAVEAKAFCRGSREKYIQDAIAVEIAGAN